MTCALLIDGENLGCHHAAALLAAVPPDTAVRRVYGDATRLNGWRGVPGLSPVHAEPGRNAADILIAVEAARLLWRDGFRDFALATSDGGLAHLVTHLREAGARVTVLGERKAPVALRAAAHRFVVLSAAAPARSLPAPAPAPLDVVTGIVRRAGPDGCLMSALSEALQRERRTGLAAWLGHPGPRAFLAAHPDRFAVDPRGAGARVRLVAPALPAPAPPDPDSPPQG